MRIIGGKYGGRVIVPPKGLPVRPTTDRAREALFNVLNNRIDWEDLRALDLFAGTGMVSFEIWSRGAASVVSVDQDRRCVAAIRQGLTLLGIGGEVVQADAFAYAERVQGPFGLIFMDPPYAIAGQEQLISRLLERDLLTEDGLLVAEHSTHRKMSHVPGYTETRVYGDSSLSFFVKL